MLTGPRSTTFAPTFKNITRASLPGWVQRIFEDSVKRDAYELGTCGPCEGFLVSIIEASDLMLINIRIPEAASLAPLLLQQRTAQTYHAIRHILKENQSRHAVRIWNYIPNIQEIMPDGLDRYMVFNAGRYAAYYDWFCQQETLGSHIPTATGIGHTGTDLLIHVLATKQAGQPVENPRQVLAQCYSHRYGPMPPCFARATITPSQDVTLPDLLIGGTASVCGEQSTHDNDITAQTEETLVNLAHLTGAAIQSVHGVDAANLSSDIDTLLRRFQSMRIYYRDACHYDTIKNIVWPRVDHIDPLRVEMVHADICRQELLVEIEGTATLSQPQSSGQD